MQTLQSTSVYVTSFKYMNVANSKMLISPLALAAISGFQKQSHRPKRYKDKLAKLPKRYYQSCCYNSMIVQ